MKQNLEDIGTDHFLDSDKTYTKNDSAYLIIYYLKGEPGLNIIILTQLTVQNTSVF